MVDLFTFMPFFVGLELKKTQPSAYQKYLDIELLFLLLRRKPLRRGAYLRVACEGFEPPNAEQSDLQSDPFGRLGNTPSHFVMNTHELVPLNITGTKP